MVSHAFPFECNCVSATDDWVMHCRLVGLWFECWPALSPVWELTKQKHLCVCVCVCLCVCVCRVHGLMERTQVKGFSQLSFIDSAEN